jgi:diguanylate cyclase (GGDEF)-like protein/PAS domain S-box-containing protein
LLQSVPESSTSAISITTTPRPTAEVAIVGNLASVKVTPNIGRLVAWLTVLVAAYTYTCWVGLRSAVGPTHLGVVWPSAAIALVSCLTWGARAWPGVYLASGGLAAWVVATPAGLTPAAVGLAASIAAGVTLQAAVTAWLLQRMLPLGFFTRPSTVFRFTGLAALGTVIAPAWTIATLLAFRLTTPNEIPSVLPGWWLADFTSMVVFAPLLLQWREIMRVSRRRGWVLEAIGTVIATVTISVVVYLSWGRFENPQNLIAFFALPSVVWIAFRFRPPGVALTAAFLPAIAIAAISHENSLVSETVTAESFQLLQLFSGLVAATGLALSAAITGQKRAEKAMRAENLRYLDLYENAPDMFATVDVNTKRITECNDTLAKALGMTKADIVGRSIFDLYHPDCIVSARAAFEIFQRTGAVRGIDLQLKRNNGSKIDVSLTATAVYDANGHIVGRRSSWTDISARKIAERTLQDSQDLWRHFIEQAPAAIAMFDREMRYLAVSRRFISDAGFPPNIELYGASHYQVFPTMPEHWKEAHRRALAGEVISVEEDPFETKDGRTQWLHWEVRPWYDVNGLGGVVVYTEDVSRRKQATDDLLKLNAELESRVRDRTMQLEHLAREMEELSLTDQLSGLANRRALDQKLAEEVRLSVRHRMPLSLVLLDIDHFKQYNDTFGHPAGDDVLRAVGHLLRDHTRTTDCAARYGGEEFALLLRHTAEGGAMVVAERVRQAIADAMWQHRSITVSVGVATLWRHSTDSGSLLGEADRALYDAKRRGRNCVVSASELATPNEDHREHKESA